MKKSRSQPRAEPRPKTATSGSDAVNLDFPVAPGFKSVPPRIGFQVMLQRIEETKPWLDPEYQRRRLERHGEHVEFVL